jgi:hypothetical protein
MVKKTDLSRWLILICVLVIAPALQGQEVVREGLASFPTQTIRVEYSGLATLRTLPNYVNLRQRFSGPRLQGLETSLAQLGIREGDIDGLLLGWQMGSKEMDLFGLAAGRFNARDIADRASALTLSSTTVAGLPVYCLAPGGTSTCIVALNDSLGAFGNLPTLTTMLEARDGGAPTLNSDNRFVLLTGEASKNVPIWGVAIGPAVEDWFRGWSPAQGSLKMDWAHLLQGVDSMIYTVAASDRVRLDVKLDSSTPEAAARVRQLLDGLRLAQTIAWQTQNPGRANPFESMEVGLQSNRVSLGVTMPYGSLEGVKVPSAP